MKRLEMRHVVSMRATLRRVRQGANYEGLFDPLSLIVVDRDHFAPAAERKKVKVAKPPKIGSTRDWCRELVWASYHGRRAANGEIYDMEKLTAAHRTYPFDTWVRVKNLSNDRTVDVRIQDRGPFIRGRIIDLSHAAAREIEMIGPGITKVSYRHRATQKHRAKQPELFARSGRRLQGSDARTLAFGGDEQRFGAARVVERAANPPMYRVLVGEYETEEQAERDRIADSRHRLVGSDCPPRLAPLRISPASNHYCLESMPQPRRWIHLVRLSGARPRSKVCSNRWTR